MAGETVSGMLLHPRIIPQIFKAFREEDLELLMYNCNIPTRSLRSKRLGATLLPDGRLGITVGIENLEHEHSYANTIIVLFDGSDIVGICNLSDIKKLDDLNNSSNLHMVAVGDARQVLIEQYWVSFDKEWHTNLAPVFDRYGIPFDPDYWLREQDDEAIKDVDAADKELVYGYFHAERLLNIIAPDKTILDVGFADCEDANIDLFEHLFEEEDEE